MNSTAISFGVIEPLADNTFQLIVDEGIELSLKEAQELENTLSGLASAPYKLLILRQHAYSYKVDFLQHLDQLTPLFAVAVVVNSSLAQQVSEFETTLLRGMTIFLQRAEALEWLRLQNETGDKQTYPATEKPVK